MILVLDIDDTLASTANREHFIDKPNPTEEDWEQFDAPEHVSQDEPIIEAQMTLPDVLDQVDDVILLTGRMENLREITEAWLDKNFDIKVGEGQIVDLIMRPDDDIVSTGAEYKEAIIQDVILSEYGDELILFIDDSEDNVEMMRNYGIALQAPDIWEELAEGTPLDSFV
jgi:hypothetical protein